MKSILITGCNRGLGLGLVRTLIKQSNPPQHIFATCRDIEKAQELREVVDSNPNISIHLIQLDIRETESHAGAVEYVTKTVGTDGLNVLFNNAGTGGRAVRLGATKEMDMLEAFRVNACAPVMMTKSFLPLLKTAAKLNATLEPGISRAAVINQSSILASMTANADGGNYAYRMSKAALNAATKTMSVEFAALGILALALHPGWVRTDLGGPRAPLEVEPTMAELWTTLRAVGAKHNGAFLDYRGELLEW